MLAFRRRIDSFVIGRARFCSCTGSGMFCYYRCLRFQCVRIVSAILTRLTRTR